MNILRFGFLGIVCVILLLSGVVLSCSDIKLRWQNADIDFFQLSLSDQESLGELIGRNIVFSGRPAYRSHHDRLFLYHSYDSVSGIGSWWLVDADIVPAATVGFIQSWAITPDLLGSSHLNDGHVQAKWKVRNGISDDLQEVVDVSVICSSMLIDILYFDGSARLQPTISGFYVRHFSEESSGQEKSRGSVEKSDDAGFRRNYFIKVKEKEDESSLFLFPLPAVTEPVECGGKKGDECMEGQISSTTWLIGDQVGMDAGLAFTTVQVHVQGGVSDEEQRLSVDPVSALVSSAETLQWLLVPPISRVLDDQGSSNELEPAMWQVDPFSRLIAVQKQENSQIDIYTALKKARSIKELPPGKRLEMLFVVSP